MDLYRLADLFNLTLLEKAVIDFLVKHLSELLKSRPEDVLTLPYCLLQEVLKSDRLTSLSEEQIWQVRVLCMGLSWCGEGMKWLKVKGLRNNDSMLFGLVLIGLKSSKSRSPDGQMIGEHQPLRLGGLCLLSLTQNCRWASSDPFCGFPKPSGGYIRKSQGFFYSPDKNSFLNRNKRVDFQVLLIQWNQISGIRINSVLSCKQFRNISLLQQRAAETLSETKLYLHCIRKIFLLSLFCIHCYFPKPCLFPSHSILFKYPLSGVQEDVLHFQVDYSI